MATALDQIRQQYPQYKDVPDRQLADALYAKFYEGKIDKPAYYQQLGLTTEDREKWGTLEKINNFVNQVGTGAYKGLAGLFGLPGTLSDLGVAMDLPRKYGGIGGTPNPNAPTENLSPFPSATDIEQSMQTDLGIPFAPRETTADKLLQAGGAGATWTGWAAGTRHWPRPRKPSAIAASWPRPTPPPTSPTSLSR